MTWIKRRKGWAMSRAIYNTMRRDHSPTFPSLHLRHNSFPNPSVALRTSQLIPQPFRRFTYVTTHSPTVPTLYLLHSSFSNHSVALPMSHLILQPFFRFFYVTSSSLNSSDEPPMSHGSSVVDVRHVKEPQAKFRASEQNLSDFSCSL